ncbi:MULTISPECIES: PAAR domain-containing protein [unclassified Acinetobacter]|uniref:PAAR domain-containing protein n=1 Tax=unclassified Acinetobacter TaxID=196816 RepID=UPI001F4A5820|nr:MULTISPECIES: PAAR domain-containing protein [unclassified Acinetobacter]MCH7350413.1 PAAR domain-containing protein [Acinetobacter sp. NIPH 2023]MCH7357947.1 PAAR domain-containing protein [Acinetobacter sp. NIPH 2024]
MKDRMFLHELSIEQLETLSESEIQEIYNIEQACWNNKPHTIYYVATHGAKSRNDGLVNASSHAVKVAGLSLACVGDEVIYADGTTSKIISGAGAVCSVDGVSVALVGSRLENGDEIIESPNTSIAIRIFKDQPIPENFLNHG